MSVPALRFRDDDGKEFPEWEESTIGERVTEKSAKFNPEKSSDTFKCIELEHLSQNTGELLGYTDTSLSKSIKNKFVTGDVLFGKLRPYLKKFLKAPFAGVCSTEIWVLKGKNISNDYLFQFVQTEYFITQTNISSGSKMPRADWNVVSSAPSYFPIFAEQTKIANFLTAVDEKITLLTQKADLLSQYKKGVMQQIFSQELRFKDDDGQEFPEWEEKRIGDVFNFKQGIQCAVEHQFLEKNELMVRFIRIIDLTNKNEPERYIYSPNDEHIIQSDDIFMVRYGTPGLVGYGYEGVIANNLFRIMALDKSVVSSKFYYFVFLFKNKDIESLSNSSTMPAINFNSLKVL